MKKFAAMCLGLSMLAGSAPVFAADKTDATKTKKAAASKTVKPKKAKKTDLTKTG